MVRDILRKQLVFLALKYDGFEPAKPYANDPVDLVSEVFIIVWDGLSVVDVVDQPWSVDEELAEVIKGRHDLHVVGAAQLTGQRPELCPESY